MCGLFTTGTLALSTALATVCGWAQGEENIQRMECYPIVVYDLFGLNGCLPGNVLDICSANKTRTEDVLKCIETAKQNGKLSWIDNNAHSNTDTEAEKETAELQQRTESVEGRKQESEIDGKDSSISQPCEKKITLSAWNTGGASACVFDINKVCSRPNNGHRLTDRLSGAIRFALKCFKKELKNTGNYDTIKTEVSKNLDMFSEGLQGEDYPRMQRDIQRIKQLLSQSKGIEMRKT